MVLKRRCLFGTGCEKRFLKVQTFLSIRSLIYTLPTKLKLVCKVQAVASLEVNSAREIPDKGVAQLLEECQNGLP